MQPHIRRRISYRARADGGSIPARGGSPDAYDRVVASRLGAAAGRMVLEGKYGCMAAFRNNEIVPVPLKEVAGKLKMVDPKSDIIREARDMGISFGNEL